MYASSHGCAKVELKYSTLYITAESYLYCSSIFSLTKILDFPFYKQQAHLSVLFLVTEI